MKLHPGIDGGYTGAMAGLFPDGKGRPHPVQVQELGRDRFRDVVAFWRMNGGPEPAPVFGAYEPSRKNPRFGTGGNFVNGKNGGFWRVLLPMAEVPCCAVNPQTWPRPMFAGVRGPAPKAMAAGVVPQRFPGITYENYTAEQIPGVNDAVLIALWARENHK